MVDVQKSLGLAGVPDKRLKGPKGLPQKPCKNKCGMKVHRLVLKAGSDHPYGSQPIQCDTTPTPEGQFFVVEGKWFMRRRDEDTGLFYRLHRCSAVSA